MDARDIRGFVERDWARVAAAKADYWVARKHAVGAAEGLRISDELRRQVIATRGEWPGPAERAADLAAHVALSRRMRDAHPPRRS